MKPLQNEYYYKSLLAKKISEFMTEITNEDNELGYLSESLEAHMAEAAWLVLRQSVDTNNFLRQEGILKD